MSTVDTTAATPTGPPPGASTPGAPAPAPAQAPGEGDPALTPAPPAPDDGSLAGIPRSVLVLVGAGGLVLAVAGMRSAADLLAPTFLAITLVVTVGPMQQWLLRHRVPGWLVITASVVVLYALLLGLLAALVLSVTQLVGLLPRYFGQFQDLYTQAVDALQRLGLSDQQVADALAQVDPSSLFGFVRTFLQGALAGLTQTVSILTLLAVVLLFLVVDAVSTPRRMELAGASHPRLVESVSAFARGVRRYWLVTTVFGIVVAVLDVAVLYWLGIPLALTWGLLAFITNYIPNVGFVLGLAPPALLGLLEGGVGRALAVVAAYSVLNVVIQTMIQPRFTGDAVGLTSTAAFLSLIFWAFVLGPLGALLAIPMTAFVKAVLVDADPRARWVNAVIASSPARAMRAPTLRLPRRRRT